MFVVVDCCYILKKKKKKKKTEKDSSLKFVCGMRDIKKDVTFMWNFARDKSVFV